MNVTSEWMQSLLVVSTTISMLVRIDTRLMREVDALAMRDGEVTQTAVMEVILSALLSQ